MSKPWEETWEAHKTWVLASDGDAIATVNSGLDAIHDADSEERARMMAAAPDLYRALESVMWREDTNEELLDFTECVGCGGLKDPHPKYPQFVGHDKDCLLATALKKARGQP